MTVMLPAYTEVSAAHNNTAAIAMSRMLDVLLVFIPFLSVELI
jgi:hypothetical protein